MRIGMMIGEGAGECPRLMPLSPAPNVSSCGPVDRLDGEHLSLMTRSISLGLVGRETKRLELGTAVVPTYPRHPAVMAQQALTTQAASNGRFTLGIGLSHQVVIEKMFGLSYERRISHMREYLSVLKPLLRGEAVKYRGEEYQVNMSLKPPGLPVQL
jgi:alkanesulfonate monooxygenase SsuD/methylene tetrahydromethanopterin reductase-like flavin-dependent oxidoreductase (luciferase family)